MHTFSDKRVMPYTAEQMFDLVSDIESYPKFLPWTAATRIRDRREDGDAVVEIADMIVSFKVFREKFGTKVTMNRQECTIVSEYIDGPFKYLVSKWAFRDVQGGCEVDYHIDFEFKNRILQKTAGVFFTEAQRQIMGAFEKRANVLYA
ncbi:type II toxin-antitoxin system RatA family toxin [Aliiruegeria sabulilitoris]|uniref:type II toxin-antitoxin system RatA family toxin n=1 Tax=Aliiruegeria sabulilitoris TaxID=1510458 RepID=UPI00082BF03F|nr:type II toxin-antitoxin system RatA family toxin [Aliiruegeria sabulilitoris]NDR58286.1 type II toxin-antitoxin system RatA family toxin [Pseudoruegeria sp. M32A2M]